MADEEPVRAGRLINRLTFTGLVPAGHANETGRPVTAGDADSTQVAECATVAVNVMAPPAGGSPSGVTPSEINCGGAGFTLADSEADCVLPPGPFALSLN